MITIIIAILATWILMSFRNNDETKYWLGPSSWPQWLLRFLPFALKFNEAAKEHDIKYGLGGTQKEKEIADTNFKYDMLSTCGYNLLAYIFAFIYYQAVSKMGFRYFTWSEEK